MANQKKPNAARPANHSKQSTANQKTATSSLAVWSPNHPLLFAGVSNLLLFLIVGNIWTMGFQTNDDVGMMLQVSGKLIVTAPTPNILFSNILLGKLLSWLYSNHSTVPWYGLYLTSSLWLSCTAVCWVLLRRLPFWLGMASYLTLFVFGCAFLLVSIQFTMVAGFAAIAGLAVFFSDTSETAEKPEKRTLDLQNVRASLSFPTAALSGGLLFLSFLIREQMFQLICALALPAGLFWVWKSRGHLPLLAGRAAIIGLVGVCCLFAKNLNTSTYEGEGDYERFNALRGALLDNRVLEEIPPENRDTLLKNVGWSRNDYFMLMSWFFMDEQVYSIEKMQALVDGASASKSQPSFDEIWNFQVNLFTSGEFACMAALSLFLALLFFRDWRPAGVWVATLFTLAGLLYLVQMQTKEPPVRVWYPALLVLAFVPIWVGLSQPTQRSKTRMAATAIAFAGLLWAGHYTATMIGNQSAKHEKSSVYLRSIITRLAPTDEQLYFVWGGSFAYEGILPLENTSFLDHFHLFGLGTSQRSAASKAILEKFGIQDAYRSVCENPNIRLFAHKNNDKVFRRYMLEHYQKDVRFEEALSYSKDFALFKVTALPGTYILKEQVNMK